MTDPPAAAPRRPRRFSWPMRLFLAVLLFDMFFRAFSALYPWRDWAEQLHVRSAPTRLPTRMEIAQLRQQATPDKPDPVGDEVYRALDNFWDFFKPWPEESARKKLAAWPERGKWAAAWLNTRLEFVEGLVAFNNEWPMFSPGASTYSYFTRARLVYADGSERIVRGRGDALDFTRFSLWNIKKSLTHESKVRPRRGRIDEAFGYCNLVRHRHPHSNGGAALVRIFLYRVRIDAPEPGVDAHAWYAEQSWRPANTSSDFYVYDVKAGHGKYLGDD